ncbi:hypothetical protein niasHT_010657 [Heterodera trifolii]|uniref:Uncharacterized protein n=1 Tax=Heterodera trifolii TaxID=157864 RepID=A0ABD2LEJ3_9BILA
MGAGTIEYGPFEFGAKLYGGVGHVAQMAGHKSAQRSLLRALAGTGAVSSSPRSKSLTFVVRAGPYEFKCCYNVRSANFGIFIAFEMCRVRPFSTVWITTEYPTAKLGKRFKIREDCADLAKRIEMKATDAPDWQMFEFMGHFEYAAFIFDFPMLGGGKGGGQ